RRQRRADRRPRERGRPCRPRRRLGVPPVHPRRRGRHRGGAFPNHPGHSSLCHGGRAGRSGGPQPDRAQAPRGSPRGDPGAEGGLPARLPQAGEHPRDRRAGAGGGRVQVRGGAPLPRVHHGRDPRHSAGPEAGAAFGGWRGLTGEAGPLTEKIAITCGDPAGIGPEIIAAWLASNPSEARGVSVVGPSRWLDTLADGPGKIAVGLDDYAARPGRPDGESALVAWAALERAAALCGSGEFAGVVTAPVSKERMAAIGWGFPGHTEFFAARWGGAPTMALCGGGLRGFASVPGHIRLRGVPASPTPATMGRTVPAADELARSEGVASPRIG